jgi:ribosome maturation factor RimP
MRGKSNHAPSPPRRAGLRGSQRPAGQKPPRGGVGASCSPPELASVLAPVIATAGMDLESVRVTTVGRRRLLQVVVDADTGPGLDDIAKLSRKLSARLDASGVMGEAPYTLEVSSPGVDRLLTEPRHWRRARGRLVSVPLASGFCGQGKRLPGPAGSRPASPAPGPAPAEAGPGHPAGGSPVPGAGPLLHGRVVAADEAGVTLEIAGQHRDFSYAELGPGRVQVEFAPGGHGGH